MANELIAYGQSGITHDFFLFNEDNEVWDGSAFVTWVDADYQDYRVAATETGTSGRFIGDSVADTTRYDLRVRSATLAGSYVVFEDDLTEDNLDWTEAERAQIRYRLGLDGDTEEPTIPETDPVIVLPSEDPSTTTAYLTTRDENGTVEANVTITFKLLHPPEGDGNSYSFDEIEATSNGVGLLTTSLLRGARYSGKRSSGRSVIFNTSDEDTYELPQING